MPQQKPKLKQDKSEALVLASKSNYQEEIGTKSKQAALLDDLINVIAPYCTYVALVRYGSVDKKHRLLISEFLMQDVSRLVSELNLSAIIKPPQQKSVFRKIIGQITDKKEVVDAEKLKQEESQCHLAMQLLLSMTHQNKNKKSGVTEEQIAEATEAITKAETAFIGWLEKNETREMLHVITKTPKGLTYFESTMSDFYFLAADNDSSAILVKLNEFLFRTVTMGERNVICFYPVIIQNILQKIHSNINSETTWLDEKMLTNPSLIEPILQFLKNVMSLFCYWRFALNGQAECSDRVQRNGTTLSHSIS